MAKVIYKMLYKASYTCISYSSHPNFRPLSCHVLSIFNFKFLWKNPVSRDLMFCLYQHIIYMSMHFRQCLNCRPVATYYLYENVFSPIQCLNGRPLATYYLYEYVFSPMFELSTCSNILSVWECIFHYPMFELLTCTKREK